MKKNFEKIFASGRQIHIRIPVISGINDDPQGFVDFFSKFDTSSAVFEFLAYHEFGKDKWTQEYEIKDGFVSDETIADFKKLFVANGLSVTAT